MSAHAWLARVQLLEGRTMSLKALLSIFLGILLLSFVGCSDTGIGAGVGAGGGALVGSAVGHPWIGALVGGAGGAVVGHEIGKSNNNSDQPRPTPTPTPTE